MRLFDHGSDSALPLLRAPAFGMRLWNTCVARAASLARFASVAGSSRCRRCFSSHGRCLCPASNFVFEPGCAKHASLTRRRIGNGRHVHFHKRAGISDWASQPEHSPCHRRLCVFSACQAKRGDFMHASVSGWRYAQRTQKNWLPSAPCCDSLTIFCACLCARLHDLSFWRPVPAGHREDAGGGHGGGEGPAAGSVRMSRRTRRWRENDEDDRRRQGNVVGVRGEVSRMRRRYGRKGRRCCRTIRVRMWAKPRAAPLPSGWGGNACKNV